MRLKLVALGAALALGLPAPAEAQSGPAQTQSQAQEQSGTLLTQGCRNAAQAGGQGPMQGMMGAMHGMMGQMEGMTGQGHAGMQGQMTQTQRALLQAMMRQMPAAMQGIMARDADVAWICAMIPHHQAAIDMARAALQDADNDESRRLAEETIRSQEQEIAKLKAWVERESRNETTGSTRQ